MFGLSSRDLGRPLQDLELSYRPVELRSCIDQAYAGRRSARLRDVEWPASPGGAAWLDVEVTPLQDPAGNLLGVLVSFEDTTRYRRLQEELRQSHEELQTAYEELQSTNEELETTNEELQSTIEELETTNEELQSTNDELETMNEELQMINEQLRRRSQELDRTNLFLGSILSSIQSGVAVVDAELRVQIWNQKAEDLWGLRAAEVVGTHLLNLDIGLPVEHLRAPLRACLAGEVSQNEIVLEATNRRGKAIQCTVTCMPLSNMMGEIQGVILIMEERDGIASGERSGA